MDKEQVFIADNYLTVTAGEPIRLFPLKNIFKNGQKRGAELIAALRLPHFKPVIKLGSHADNAPAAGHIASLEIRDGYLWGIPEWNDRGRQAIEAGEYKYNSPEVIWEGGLEDSDTGEVIQGPLIVGDALLHMPAMASTALYNVTDKELSMTENTVPVSFLEKFMDFFKAEREQEPKQAEPVVTFEAEYQAATEQVEILQAQLAQVQADQEHGAIVAKFAAEFAGTSLAEDAEIHELLADVEEDKAGILVNKFRALSARADMAKLNQDVGVSGDPNAGNPDAAFDAAIRAKMEEAKVSYNAAVPLVIADNPELYNNWGGK
jgi:hypothetical protein